VPIPNAEDEATDGGLLGVRFKELMQHRLKSGCSTSERMRLEAEIEMIMNE